MAVILIVEVGRSSWFLKMVDKDLLCVTQNWLAFVRQDGLTYQLPKLAVFSIINELSVLIVENKGNVM